MSLRALLNVAAAELRERIGDEAYEEWRAMPDPEEEGPRQMKAATPAPGNRGDVRALLAITKTMPRERPA